MKESRFTSVQQFSEILALIDKHFPYFTDEKKAEILKCCFKISASD